ncbi:hypothetical protein BFL38_03195 [Brachyspira hampsonii]|uniref:NGG1p interacting factor NIF3 n=1 Tax=Brachyspira hampsonii TaxID=1287055 RepID=A0A1E5NCF0_9SPIR|nr:hypothetical protein [Brachyspira hampsonii]OEJ13767.1 hypothetical protein BFL38_03195 [Brachyspira hampsonii]
MSLKINDFYRAAIDCAIDADPRGRETVEKELSSIKKNYDKLDEKNREYFDKDTLFNPYSDTRILNIAEDKDIKKILCGIDMQTAELLLADRLNEKNYNIDLVITHHPNGYGFVNFYDVIAMQAEKNALHDVAVNVSEGLTNKRLNEVSRSVFSSNHYRDVDCARLLKLNYMCMHTVADNFVESFLTEKIKKENPYTLSDIIDILYTIDEYKISAKRFNPPKIFNGSNKSKVGKFIADMTGGASFDVGMIEALSKAGVSTILMMNISDRLLDECRKYYINVVCAGHISSDSLGINLLFKAIKDKTKEDFEIIPASGYIFVEK